MYGPTETTIWSTCSQVQQNAVLSIGAINNTDIAIIDAHQQHTPIGIAGEICIGGHGLAQGYWQLPEKTAEQLLRTLDKGTPGAKPTARAIWGIGIIRGVCIVWGVRWTNQTAGYRIEIGEIESRQQQSPALPIAPW